MAGDMMKFGGKIFRSYGGIYTKSQAHDTAKRLRNLCNRYVRIVKPGGYSIYLIYTRKKEE